MDREDMPKGIQHMAHYYGDIVRKLFVVGGVIMVLALPFYPALLPIPTFFSVLLIVVIAVAAGLTNPTQSAVMAFNTGVALVALIVFEYRAVTAYGEEPVLFLIAQSLALIFFVATYFSTKTVRGSMVH